MLQHLFKRMKVYKKINHKLRIFINNQQNLWLFVYEHKMNVYQNLIARKSLLFSFKFCFEWNPARWYSGHIDQRSQILCIIYETRQFKTVLQWKTTLFCSINFISKFNWSNCFWVSLLNFDCLILVEVNRVMNESHAQWLNFQRSKEVYN